MLKKLTILVAAIVLAAALSSCTKARHDRSFPEKEVVMVFYGAGFNNLSSDIKRNIGIIKKGKLPFKDSRHKVLIFTHLSNSDSDFANLTESHLVELSRDFGVFKADTLLTISKERYASDPQVLHEVMQKVAELYPDAHYGLIVSSHGTGWLPAGRYTNSSNVVQYSVGSNVDKDLPLYRYNEDPGSPKVKSFSAEAEMRNGIRYSHETSIQSMAKAIGVHLDYLIFDACLMGCVEVAYEFKDVADKIAFSPTEVLVDGFDYTDISTLLNDNIDLEGFCKRYFDYYDKHPSSRYATISAIRTDKLDALASLCSTLFEKYRSSINSLTMASGVQRYYRSGYSWFYDFEDIFVKAGISEADKAALDAALDACITYKAYTPLFISIEINTYSGLSMHIPSEGNADLRNFYKTLKWNEATNLVE